MDLDKPSDERKYVLGVVISVSIIGKSFWFCMHKPVKNSEDKKY